MKLLKNGNEYKKYPEIQCVVYYYCGHELLFEERLTEYKQI